VTALVAAISGLYGLVIGSFLNVVIWRSRKESLVKPPSHCPDTKIATRDNIPVVSWFCSAAVVQLWQPHLGAIRSSSCSLGVLWAAVGARFAHSCGRCPYLVPPPLIALSAIDLEHYILPNRILYPTDGAMIVLLAVASAGRATGAYWCRGGRRIKVRHLLHHSHRVARYGLR
jgi:leader peptidase (prepilin peptidase)/N-methyltransferase